MESKAKIIDLILIKSGKSQEKIKKSQEALIILNKTPFYAEAGGQVGDIGILLGDKFEFEVQDTQKIGDHIGHIGILSKGNASKGDQVLATVNKVVRKNTALNHSSTHLLHSALREVLGLSLIHI